MTLVPLGGTGCGIELAGGVAYSIGDQNVGAEYTDGCNIVNTVLINGGPAPAAVTDGQAIGVTFTTKNNGYICGASPPSCVQTTLSLQKATSGRLKLMLNPSLRFTRRKLRR